MRWLVQRSRNRVPAGAQRQRLYLQVRWLEESQLGHGVEIEEDHAQTPQEPTAKPMGMAYGRLRLHQSPAGGVGLRDALRYVGGQESLVGG